VSHVGVLVATQRFMRPARLHNTHPRMCSKHKRQPTGWRPGFGSRQGQEIVLCSTASGPAVGSMQWLSGVKRRGHEVDHTPPATAEVKNVPAIPPFPIGLHGVVRLGTALSFRSRHSSEGLGDFKVGGQIVQ
jgi:hypothetical protein